MSSKLDKPIITQHLFPLSTSIVEDDSCGEKLVFHGENGATINCCFFEAEPDSPIILFFPSTDETPAAFAPRAAEFQKHGMSIIFITYQAYDDNRAAPCFSQMLENAKYLIGAVTQRLTQENKKIALFVMGQSLGTAFAIDTALHNSENVKGLILDSSICQTMPFLDSIGIDTSEFNLSESEGFNNLHKISKITLPTIIFHGSKDTLVKASEAESLQACCGARSKQFFVIPGGTHCDLSAAGGETYFTTLRSYINTTCGFNTWRQRRRKFKTYKNE